MNRTKSKSGRVIGEWNDGIRRGKIEATMDGRIRIISFDPLPIHQQCPLDYPNIDWPSSKNTAPSGPLITGLFGEYGWNDNTLVKEVQDSLTRAAAPLTTTHDLSSWTASLAAHVCCGTCNRLSECESISAHIASESAKRPVDEPDEEDVFSGQSDPIERRIELYYHAWVKLRDYHLKRAVLVLAILGKNGMRPGGYFKRDIARIAGVSPQNHNSVNRIIEKLGSWGFLKRQKRRSRMPRYRYSFGGNSVGMQAAADEAMTDYAKRNILDLIQRETRVGLKEGVNYSEAGFVNLVGAQPPYFVVNLVRDLSDAVLYDVFWGLLEPRIAARSGGKTWKNKDIESYHTKRIMHTIRALQNICDSLDEKQASEWEYLWGGLASGNDKRGLLLLLDIPMVMEWLSR